MFADNIQRVLDAARSGRVDLVVHGGDLFYRSRIWTDLALSAIEMIRGVAGRVPFVIVPDNHERSTLPFPLLWSIEGLHVFDRPRTIRLGIGGRRVALAGFPHTRLDLRCHFTDLVARARPFADPADLRLLCIHQLVEGAVVGPAGYRFGDAPDIVPAACIPSGYAAGLAGHLHRHQVLPAGPGSRRPASPVCFAGSTQRTSAAEGTEVKGFLTLRFGWPDGREGRLTHMRFHLLPGRARGLG